MSQPLQDTPEAPVRPPVQASPVVVSPPTDTLLHWVFLALASVVLLLAVVLRVQGEEQVVIPGFNAPLPGTCTFKQYAGLDCPGCGLTRCFVSMAKGNVSRAWHFNPVGIVFFGVVVFQVPYRMLQIWRARRGHREMQLGWWGYSCLVIVAVALLVQWGIRVTLGLLP